MAMSAPLNQLRQHVADIHDRLAVQTAYIRLTKLRYEENVLYDMCADLQNAQARDNAQLADLWQQLASLTEALNSPVAQTPVAVDHTPWTPDFCHGHMPQSVSHPQETIPIGA